MINGLGFYSLTSVLAKDALRCPTEPIFPIAFKALSKFAFAFQDILPKRDSCH
jgi:hypothetical protein